MTIQTKKSGQPLLVIAAALWLIWGLVHTIAGCMTIIQDTPLAVQGIADAIEPSVLNIDYPAAAGAIINQHGFNLLWIGLVTTICAFFVWRRSHIAIFLAALVGGLADVGYFIYLDLGGFVNFVPGTVMTIVSSIAIFTSFYVYFAHIRKE